MSDIRVRVSRTSNTDEKDNRMYPSQLTWLWKNMKDRELSILGMIPPSLLHQFRQLIESQRVEGEIPPSKIQKPYSACDCLPNSIICFHTFQSLINILLQLQLMLVRKKKCQSNLLRAQLVPTAVQLAMDMGLDDQFAS